MMRLVKVSTKVCKWSIILEPLIILLRIILWRL